MALCNNLALRCGANPSCGMWKLLCILSLCCSGCGDTTGTSCMCTVSTEHSIHTQVNWSMAGVRFLEFLYSGGVFCVRINLGTFAGCDRGGCGCEGRGGM